MQAFAVQTIPQGSKQSQFVIVSADSAEQALAFVAQQSIEAGNPETAMVAVFSGPELENLAAAVRDASQGLASQEA